MESNYLKSARIKLEHLGIKDYKDLKMHYTEVFDIIDDCLWKEWARRMNDSLPAYSEVHPGYMDFVDFRKLDPIPEQKPWQTPQTLEYYTCTPTKFVNDYIERIKLK